MICGKRNVVEISDPLNRIFHGEAGIVLVYCAGHVGAEGRQS